MNFRRMNILWVAGNCRLTDCELPIFRHTHADQRQGHELRFVCGTPKGSDEGLGVAWWFALVIDVGGDDVYRGTIGANASVEQGVNVVIDLAGNDRYHGSPMGLAMGRLGIGLVADLGGTINTAYPWDPEELALRGSESSMTMRAMTSIAGAP